MKDALRTLRCCLLQLEQYATNGQTHEHNDAEMLKFICARFGAAIQGLQAEYGKEDSLARLNTLDKQFTATIEPVRAAVEAFRNHDWQAGQDCLMQVHKNIGVMEGSITVLAAKKDISCTHPHELQAPSRCDGYSLCTQACDVVLNLKSLT